MRRDISSKVEKLLTKIFVELVLRVRRKDELTTVMVNDVKRVDGIVREDDILTDRGIDRYLVD